MGSKATLPTLLLLLCAAPACGDDADATTADAGPADGGGRADADPAALVHVQVLGGQPANGYRILFHDPAGHIVHDTRTDSDARAAAELPEGGSVTWLVGRSLITETEVLPGEDVTFGSASEDHTLAGTMKVEFTPVESETEVRYTVLDPCSIADASDSSPIEKDLFTGCFGETVDLAVIARERFTGKKLGAVLLRDVPVVFGGTITAPPFLPLDQRPLALTGVPEGTKELEASAYGRFGNNSMWFDLVEYTDPVPVVDGAITPVLEVPAGFSPDLGVHRVSAYKAVAGGFGEPYTMVERATAWAADTTGDTMELEGLMFDWLAEPTYEDGRVDWVIPAGVESADFTNVMVAPTVDNPPLEAWFLVVPGDATSVTTPDLPYDLAVAWLVKEVPPRIRLEINEADFLDGFRDVRKIRELPVGKPYVWRMTGVGY